VELAGTRIVGVLSGVPETPILLASSAGLGLRCQLGDLVTRQRAGKAFMGVGEGERVLAPVITKADTKEVAALSEQRRLLVFPLEEVNALSGGGKGVILMRLHEGESLVAVDAVSGPVKVRGKGRGDKMSVVVVAGADLEAARGTRARSGRVLPGSLKTVTGFAD
jgi:topoisomerase-4 subunit A